MQRARFRGCDALAVRVGLTRIGLWQLVFGRRSAPDGSERGAQHRARAVSQPRRGVGRGDPLSVALCLRGGVPFARARSAWPVRRCFVRPWRRCRRRLLAGGGASRARGEPPPEGAPVPGGGAAPTWSLAGRRRIHHQAVFRRAWRSARWVAWAKTSAGRAGPTPSARAGLRSRGLQTVRATSAARGPTVPASRSLVSRLRCRKTVQRNAACSAKASSHPRFDVASSGAGQTARTTARIKL